MWKSNSIFKAQRKRKVVFSILRCFWPFLTIGLCIVKSIYNFYCFKNRLDDLKAKKVAWFVDRLTWNSGNYVSVVRLFTSSSFLSEHRYGDFLKLSDVNDLINAWLWFIYQRKQINDNKCRRRNYICFLKFHFILNFTLNEKWIYLIKSFAFSVLLAADNVSSVVCWRQISFN